VVETMRPLPIEAVAGTPDAVQGLAVIRGAAVPVLDLGFFLEGRSEHPTRFVTVRTGKNHVALAVDSVVGLSLISPHSLRDVPPLLGDVAGNTVAAIGTLDAELLLVLDAALLVPESVWSAITASGEPS
jgi:purine-binding chemotaxis protein CheW